MKWLKENWWIPFTLLVLITIWVITCGKGTKNPFKEIEELKKKLKDEETAKLTELQRKHDEEVQKLMARYEKDLEKINENTKNKIKKLSDEDNMGGLLTELRGLYSDSKQP